MIEQAMVLSIERRSNVRKGCASPDWMIEPEVETYQDEQGGSSRQQGSNSKLMEMLKIMEHNMIERDSQLRNQLQIRDKYFDKEIRRRDQCLDEAIKQRKIQWKRELEERDEMWINELIERDTAY